MEMGNVSKRQQADKRAKKKVEGHQWVLNIKEKIMRVIVFRYVIYKING